LVVQAAEHAGGGTGMVVLGEVGRQAGLGETVGVEALDEEAALVAVQLQLDDHQSCDFQSDKLHRCLTTMPAGRNNEPGLSNGQRYIRNSRSFLAYREESLCVHRRPQACDQGACSMPKS